MQVLLLPRRRASVSNVAVFAAALLRCTAAMATELRRRWRSDQSRCRRREGRRRQLATQIRGPVSHSESRICSQRRAVQVAIALDSTPSTRRLVCYMAWKLTLTQLLLDPRSAMAARLVFVLAAALAVVIRATPSPRDSPLWRYAPRGRRAGTAAARRPFRPSPWTGFVRRRTCASRAAVAPGRAAPRAAPPTQPRCSSPRPASRVVSRDSPTKTRFIKGVVS